MHLQLFLSPSLTRPSDDKQILCTISSSVETIFSSYETESGIKLWGADPRGVHVQSPCRGGPRREELSYLRWGKSIQLLLACWHVLVVTNPGQLYITHTVLASTFAKGSVPSVPQAGQASCPVLGPGCLLTGVSSCAVSTLCRAQCNSFGLKGGMQVQMGWGRPPTCTSCTRSPQEGCCRY